MFQINCLNSKVENTTNKLAKFSIEPVEKGQGLTIGNALRRVLLSDLSGLAIVGVRIANANHEFSTIPGLKEDIIEILLNLKQIVFKGAIDEPIIARLRVQNPGIVTAQDIELPSNVCLVEPSQYIATLTNQTTLEMEVLIESGKGYMVSEQFINRLPTGFLALDAIFMPVRKVNFFVETSRNTTSQIIESLILEIITDGSLEPIDALHNGALVLEQLFSAFNIEKAHNFQLPEIVDKVVLEDEFDNVMLEELELSVRAYNCLKRANVHTVSQLLKYSQSDLLEFKNFGQKSSDEVCESLQSRFGITLLKT